MFAPSVLGSNFNDFTSSRKNNRRTWNVRLHSHSSGLRGGEDVRLESLRCNEDSTFGFISLVCLSLSEGNGVSQLFIKQSTKHSDFHCLLSFPVFFYFNAQQVWLNSCRRWIIRLFHDLFQSSSQLWCILLSELVFYLGGQLLYPSSQLSPTYWLVFEIEFSLCYSCLPCWQSWSVGPCGRHDKRHTLICIHKALMKFKEK